MKEINIPTIVIIITVIGALTLFLVSDHSGLSINDCTLNVDRTNSNYDLNYTLLVGRNFNLLECKYVVLSNDNKVLANGTSTIEDTHIGSYPINEKIKIDENYTPGKVNITVFTEERINENDENKTRLVESYNKMFSF